MAAQPHQAPIVSPTRLILSFAGVLRVYVMILAAWIALGVFTVLGAGATLGVIALED